MLSPREGRGARVRLSAQAAGAATHPGHRYPTHASGSPRYAVEQFPKLTAAIRAIGRHRADPAAQVGAELLGRTGPPRPIVLLGHRGGGAVVRERTQGVVVAAGYGRSMVDDQSGQALHRRTVFAGGHPRRPTCGHRRSEVPGRRHGKDAAVAGDEFSLLPRTIRTRNVAGCAGAMPW